MGGVATWTPWELLGTGGRRSGNYSSCNNNKVASVMVRREGGLAADDSPPRSGIAATSVASTHLSWSGFESQQQASKEAPALSHRREHSPFTRRVGKFISPASHLPPTYDSMLPSWLTSLPTPARTLLHSNPLVVLYAPPPSCATFKFSRPNSASDLRFHQRLPTDIVSRLCLGCSVPVAVLISARHETSGEILLVTVPCGPTEQLHSEYLVTRFIGSVSWASIKMRSRSGTCIVGLAAALFLCMSLAVGAQNVQTFSTSFDSYTANNVRVLGNGLVQIVLDQASGKPPNLYVAGSTM